MRRGRYVRLLRKTNPREVRLKLAGTSLHMVIVCGMFYGADLHCSATVGRIQYFIQET